jgi:hypothetical protein
MNAHGIEFAHRRPELPELAAQDYAQFTVFAALCASEGVSELVSAVFFDTKWQGFNITADPRVEGTGLHETIWRCALRSLPQFTLFGIHGQWERDEWPGSEGDAPAGGYAF